MITVILQLNLIAIVEVDQAACVTRIDFQLVADVTRRMCHRTALIHFPVVQLDVVAVDIVSIGVGNLSMAKNEERR